VRQAAVEDHEPIEARRNLVEERCVRGVVSVRAGAKVVEQVVAREQGVAAFDAPAGEAVGERKMSVGSVAVQALEAAVDDGAEPGWAAELRGAERRARPA
jgi:hypothetical protein